MNELDTTGDWVYADNVMKTYSEIQDKTHCPDWCFCGRSSIRCRSLFRGTGSGFSFERR